MHQGGPLNVVDLLPLRSTCMFLLFQQLLLLARICLLAHQLCLSRRSSRHERVGRSMRTGDRCRQCTSGGHSRRWRALRAAEYERAVRVLLCIASSASATVWRPSPTRSVEVRIILRMALVRWSRRKWLLLLFMLIDLSGDRGYPGL